MDHGYIGSAREQGQIERAHQASAVSKAPRRTIGSAIERAENISQVLGVTHSEMQALAERAEKLATIIGGSYPSPGHPKGTAANTDPASGGPASTVEALHLRIDAIRPQIEALTEPHLQIANALDAIERAIG